METGSFKWVWRFNAVAIAVCVILVLIVILWEITGTLRRNAFPTHTSNTFIDAREEPDQAAEQQRYFGAPNDPSNKGIYALPIYADQSHPNLGISKSNSYGRDLINYRIVDISAQTNHWLFEGMNRLILDTRMITLSYPGHGSNHLGQLLTVVLEDTNDDARLSGHDTKTLFLTNLHWNRPVKVTHGVISVLSTTAVSDSAFDIIFSTSDGTHAARIAIPTGEILSEQVLQTYD
jgi:hypothetical protein